MNPTGTNSALRHNSSGKTMTPCIQATATDPVFDAASGDVTYRVDGTEHTALRTKTTEMYTWSRAANSTTTHKHGIRVRTGLR